MRSLEEATVGDGNLFAGLARAGANLLEAFDDVLALNDLTENGVSAIEPRGLLEGDEELGAVGVGTSVRHGEEVGLGVLESEVLVSELVAVDGLATGSVAGGEVTTLSHEARDNSVELAALEVQGLSSVASSGGTVSERGEVLGGLRDSVAEHSEDNAALSLAIDLNVEEDLLGHCVEGVGKGDSNDGGNHGEKLHL